MAGSGHDELQKYTDSRVNRLGDGFDAGGKAQQRIALSFLSWVRGLMVGEASSPEREHKKPRNTPSFPSPKPVAICHTQLPSLHGEAN